MLFRECRVSEPIQILLDVSELEAPLPLQKALSAASKLKQYEYIKMVHRMKPCHLFATLEKIGVWWLDFEVSQSEYIVFMARVDDDVTKEYIKGIAKDEYDRTFT